MVVHWRQHLSVVAAAKFGLIKSFTKTLINCHHEICPTFLGRPGLNTTAFFALANSALFPSDLASLIAPFFKTFCLHGFVLHQDHGDVQFQGWRWPPHLRLPPFQERADGRGW